MDVIPRYYYGEDFRPFENYFLSKNPKEEHFQKGDVLWDVNRHIEHCYYIRSGLLQASVLHEEGYKKILSFHGPGTVFPGCHKTEFKIQNALIFTAVTDADVLTFSKEDYYKMYQENSDLNAQVLEWYAMYINLLIYASAHQEFNSSLKRICNFFVIYLKYSAEPVHGQISITQEMLADILGLSRVHISRNIQKLKNEQILIAHRNRIQIIDEEKLISYCSSESINI